MSIMDHLNSEWTPSPLYFQRKKNLVKAVQIRTDNQKETAFWCGGQVLYYRTFHPEQPRKMLVVPTLNGPETADYNDWVVKDEFGQFHVYGTSEFKERFDFIPEKDVREDQLPGQGMFDFNH